MLELHIYGPAFGLPSIDVKCLAAIALLQLSLGQDDWTLVASNNPLVSPFDELPALKAGTGSVIVWVAGFRSIASYIKSLCRAGASCSNSQISFELSEQESADVEAYLSFLESRGLPLLDLSFYVSSDNFTTVTRSSLSDILPWPQSWTVPQKLRDAARKRSDHLGLNALDVDATREKELKKENEGISAAIPQSLRIPKKSVTSLLGSPAETARFRLEAVTSGFFEPLAEQLGDKEHLLGDKMTILDCCAVSLLSQMLVDGLPQPWLKDALGKFPKLRDWAVTNQDIIFGSGSKLPWKQPTDQTWLQLGQGFVDMLAESIPIAIVPASIRKAKTGSCSAAQGQKSFEQTSQEKYLFRYRKRTQKVIIREVITVCCSGVGLVGLLAYMGIMTLRWPTFRRPQPARHGFGEAGSFLGLG